jgi:hypothetical protein
VGRGRSVALSLMASKEYAGGALRASLAEEDVRIEGPHDIRRIAFAQERRVDA